MTSSFRSMFLGGGVDDGLCLLPQPFLIPMPIPVSLTVSLTWEPGYPTACCRAWFSSRSKGVTQGGSLNESSEVEVGVALDQDCCDYSS